MIDLTELERLEKAATPGPWWTEESHVESERWTICENGWTYDNEDSEAESLAQDESNRQTIAALRNAAPELLAWVREACELLKAFEPMGGQLEHGEPDCLACAWESRRNALLARVKLEDRA